MISKRLEPALALLQQLNTKLKKFLVSSFIQKSILLSTAFKYFLIFLIFVRANEIIQMTTETRNVLLKFYPLLAIKEKFWSSFPVELILRYLQHSASRQLELTE